MDELRYATPKRALAAYEEEDRVATTVAAGKKKQRYGVMDLNLLGWRVRDDVSGLEGPVVSVSYDLNGCVMALIERGYGADGKRLDTQWIDTKRLARVSDGPVADQPVFAGTVPGGREMPAFDSKPGR